MTRQQVRDRVKKLKEKIAAEEAEKLRESQKFEPRIKSSPKAESVEKNEVCEAQPEPKKIEYE